MKRHIIATALALTCFNLVPSAHADNEWYLYNPKFAKEYGQPCVSLVRLNYKITEPRGYLDDLKKNGTLVEIVDTDQRSISFKANGESYYLIQDAQECTEFSSNMFQISKKLSKQEHAPVPSKELPSKNDFVGQINQSLLSGTEKSFKLIYQLHESTNKKCAADEHAGFVFFAPDSRPDESPSEVGSACWKIDNNRIKLRAMLSFNGKKHPVETSYWDFSNPDVVGFEGVKR
ncbi:hypothetical protein [Pseudomonas fluorescens]|uniref:hypothetical protein n=1 Tax=Pseudomonas fluorescens TaxID=294 RepID=UPI0007D062D1|nr:hypothetical protein [Pseudomonas fluorescens]